MHLLPIRCLLAAGVVLLHFGVVAPGAASATPGTFVYAPNTAFESNLNSLLASIAASTASSSGATYDSFTASQAALVTTEAAAMAGGGSASPGAAYGLYQCRGDLSAGECVACVRDTAAARLGAASDGCHVRYDAARDDTSSVAYYRKCSSGTSNDAAFLKARDGVLAQLHDGAATATTTTASGYYNVSTYGAVQGVAQCFGDDCAACLAQAVGQLKGTCGDALAAEVYLAHCSVRYWASGDYFRSSHGYSEDDVGRTVAIIIGILAGLGLLIVFISFLRKTCG